MSAFVYEKQINRFTLSRLVPVEAFDEKRHLFVMGDGYIGFGFVAKPLAGSDATVTQRLNVLLSFDYPAGSFIQVMLMGSQDIRPTLDNIKQLHKTHNEALKESMEIGPICCPNARISQSACTPNPIFVSTRLFSPLSCLSDKRINFLNYMKCRSPVNFVCLLSRR